MICATLIVLISFAYSKVYVIDPPGTCGHWTYEEADHWDELNCTTTNYCSSGRFQSPVSVDSWTNDYTLPRLTFAGYGKISSMIIKNNGHTVQATYTNGFYTNDQDQDFFQIQQFHLHTHSEERVKGQQDVLSVHLVHTKEPAPGPNKTAISVVGLLFKIGAFNPAIDVIVQALPSIIKEGDSTTVSFDGFQPTFTALKASNDDGYWNYPGSLTTPPCTEQIDWTLMSHIFELSLGQFNAINDFFINQTGGPLGQNLTNNRPIQRNLNGVSYRPGGVPPPSVANSIALSLIGFFIPLIFAFLQ